MELFGAFAGIGGLAILLVFNLYLLVHWQHVRRPIFFVIAAAAVLFAMSATFFAIGRADDKEGGVAAVHIVARVFAALGAMIAFAADVIACLPMKLPSIPKDQGAPPPAK